MSGLDRTQVIALFVVGLVAACAIVACIRHLVISYRNPKVFVAYGSLRRWYNQSPNFVFKVLRMTFGSIREQPLPTKQTLQPVAQPKSRSKSPLFQRDPADFVVEEIDLAHRTMVTAFVLRALGYDPEGVLTHVQHTLRPGDLAEIQRLIDSLHTPRIQPGRCQYQPASLKDRAPHRLKSMEFDLFVNVLVFNDKFVLLCVKYAGYIKYLIDLAHTIENPMTADGATPREHVPGQEAIGSYYNMQLEYYPNELANR